MSSLQILCNFMFQKMKSQEEHCPEHEQNKNDRITIYYLDSSLLIILILTVSILTVINYKTGF